MPAYIYVIEYVFPYKYFKSIRTGYKLNNLYF